MLAVAVPISVGHAQGVSAAGTGAPIEQIVVRPTPLSDTADNNADLPTGSTTLHRSDLDLTGTPDLLDALDTEVPGLELDSASGNPLQPSLFYNGFEASPLQGTSQGLAVYVNGVRFNESFGDTVNWDLLPQIAIDRVTLEDSDPIYGLNALGGAVSVHLRDGFGWQGGEADLSGGSFGTVTADGQYGARVGDFAFYIAGGEQHQDGWRDLQSTDVQTLFTDAGWRRDGSSVHVNLSLADSSLNGPGTTPVQLLAVDPQAQFTGPNLIANTSAQIEISGATRLGTVSLEGNAYYGYFLQRVVNGNVADDTPCENGTGLLCTSDDVASTTRGGLPITDFSNGGPISELDRQTTNTNRYGAAMQASRTGSVLGLANRALVGASFDGAQTLFSATSLLGSLTPDTRVFVGPGITIDEPGNNVPVRVGVDDAYGGAYASDSLDLTRRLTFTVAGRFNVAEVNLSDRNGTALSGRHAYDRLNPTIGATYHVADWLIPYASYAETNRVPSPAELSCAGPADTCSLANFFVGDPDLKQVVAHTIEVGARGTLDRIGGGRIVYRIGLFHTDSDDDIVFVNSPNLNRAFFTNVGLTRRQGLDASLVVRMPRWSASISYAYVEASFGSTFVESAGSNPSADADGNITIRSGDRLPGVPAQRLSFQIDGRATNRWTVGVRGILQAGQYLFGDEANLTRQLPGFFTLELHTTYQLTSRVQLFGNIENLTDTDYSTFGTFSPVRSVPLFQAPDASNPRSFSPAAPIGGFGGARVTF